jgi:hypothetical protein
MAHARVATVTSTMIDQAAGVCLSPDCADLVPCNKSSAIAGIVRIGWHRTVFEAILMFVVMFSSGDS